MIPLPACILLLGEFTVCWARDCRTWPRTQGLSTRFVSKTIWIFQLRHPYFVHVFASTKFKWFHQNGCQGETSHGAIAPNHVIVKNNMGIFLDFFIYFPLHCFICRRSNPGLLQLSNHSSHPQFGKISSTTRLDLIYHSAGFQPSISLKYFLVAQFFQVTFLSVRQIDPLCGKMEACLF